MGNPLQKSQLPTLHNQEEFNQFVILCQKVLTLKPELLKKDKMCFSGKQLIKILKNAKIIDMDTDQQMCIWIQGNLMNPLYPHQLIYPEQDTHDFQFKSSGKYMFIDDKFQQYHKNPNVMNFKTIYEIPYFYTDFYKQNQLLQDPAKLVSDIRKDFMTLKAEASDEEGTFIDYDLLASLPAWKDEYLSKINLLPYLNLSKLFEDENERLALFINIYNLLNIHSIVTFGQKNGKYTMTSSERMDFYDHYYYNIGGHNYSLNDVEHGIMRCNDAYGKSKTKAFWLLMTGQTLTDTSTPRFLEFDPRSKMAEFLKKEPRIHFTLNCGAKSCPPIRVYEGSKLEQQLKMAAINFIANNVSVDSSSQGKIVFRMSKIFSWYQGDFGKSEKEMIVYLRQYTQGENMLAFDKIINDNTSFDIKYNEYDWTVNNRKREQKAAHQQEGNLQQIDQQQAVQQILEGGV